MKFRWEASFSLELFHKMESLKLKLYLEGDVEEFICLKNRSNDGHAPMRVSIMQPLLQHTITIFSKSLLSRLLLCFNPVSCQIQWFAERTPCFGERLVFFSTGLFVRLDGSVSATVKLLISIAKSELSTLLLAG